MPKLKSQFITLCDQAIVSNQGKLSIIGIFDRIFAKTLPTKYAQFTLVAILSGEPDAESQVSIQIDDPSGKQLLPPKQLKVKAGTNSQVNIITTFTNFPLPVTGQYTITVKSDDSKIGQATLQVTQLPDQPAQPN